MLLTGNGNMVPVNHAMNLMQKKMMKRPDPEQRKPSDQSGTEDHRAETSAASYSGIPPLFVHTKPERTEARSAERTASPVFR